MASSTPSASINSSRGAADTTAGRIYFSTPSAQVRIPVGDLVSPSPHFCSHYTARGKTIRERQRKGAVGVREAGGGKIIPRRRKNYPAAEEVSRAGAGAQRFEKKPKNCRTVPKIPYSKSLCIEPNYTLSLYIEPNYTLSEYIEPNYTLS